ncbi:B-cell receptor-associated protein 31 [Fasciola gigantica]|uniref:Endoplasmic reticulum transmembrane protein n=1 Tax=Fasciola gigantica TaxID=46835 RepID=A0A504Z466_FASGI|nr:B-cell receptor-associated protein 31 [Fasciola gigantica]
MLWHLTAAFLYLEMFLFFILLSPLVSTRSWAKLFKLHWVQSLTTFSKYYFNLFLMLLVIVLVEAVRQVMNQRSAYNELKAHPSELRPETESLYLMRMFRAQRNLYIAGFALFMWFLCRRLINVINEHAQMCASQEASIKQAQNASAAAEKWMKAAGAEESEATKELKEVIEDLEDQLKREKEAHATLSNDFKVLKKQAEQTSREYDRVSTECQELQRRLDILSGSTPDKKSD